MQQSKVKRKVASRRLLKLSPNEEARLIQDEKERRRKLRLQQVREQEKAFASQLRKDVKDRKEQQISKIAAELKEEWHHELQEKQRSLQTLYDSSVKKVGEAHQEAKENVPDYDLRFAMAVEDQRKADERHVKAVRALRVLREQKEQGEKAHIVSRKAALEEEKERAARIASLPPPKPDPLQDIDLKQLNRPVRFTDADALSTTHFHMPTGYAEKAEEQEQGDAKTAAVEEFERLQDLEDQEQRVKHEQTEKARLRHKHALHRVRLDKDHEQLLHDLSDLQRQDRQHRRQVIANMPVSLFRPPHQRLELKEEEQQDMEQAFEDMYMAQTGYVGDVSLALDPHPPPATPTGGDPSLDLSVEPGEETPQEVRVSRAAQSLREKGPKSPGRDNKPVRREANLKRLLDKIKNQRDEWVTRASQDAPEPDSASSIVPFPVVQEVDREGPFLVERETRPKDAMEEGSITDTVSSSQEVPPKREDSPAEGDSQPDREGVEDTAGVVQDTTGDTIVAGSTALLHPREEAKRIRAEAAKHQEMMADLEHQKQEQLNLMQQLEQQRRQLLEQLEQERAAHDQRQQFLEHNLIQHQETERPAFIGQREDARPFAIDQVPISTEAAIRHPTSSVNETRRTVGRQPAIPEERQSGIGPRPPSIDDELITIRRHQKKLLEQYRARQESVKKVQERLEQHSQKQPGRPAQIPATNRDVVVPKLQPWTSSMGVPQSRLHKEPIEAAQASAIRQPQLVDSGVRTEERALLQPGVPTVPSSTGVPGSTLTVQKARELEDIQRRKEELIRQQEMVRRQKEEILAHQRKQEEEMRMRQQWLEQQMQEQQRQLEEQQQLYILQQTQHEASASVEEDSSTVPKEGYEREVLPEFLEREVPSTEKGLIGEPIRKAALPPKPPPAWSRQVHYFRDGPTHELSTIQEVDTPGSERVARSMALAQELDDTMRSAHQDDLGSMSLDLDGSLTQSQRRTWHDLLLSPPEATQPRGVITMATDDGSRATPPTTTSSTLGAFATSGGIETVVPATALRPAVSSAVTSSTLGYPSVPLATEQPGIVPSFAADVGRGVLGYSSVRQPVQQMMPVTATSQPASVSLSTSSAPVPSSQPTLSMEGTKYSDLAQRLSQLIDDKLSVPSNSRSSAMQPLSTVFSPLASQPRTMSQARIDQSRSLFSTLATQNYFPTIDAVSLSSEGLDISDIENPNFPQYSVKPLSLQETSFAPIQGKLEDSVEASKGGVVENYSQGAKGIQSEDFSSASSVMSPVGSEQGGPLLTQRSLNSFSSTSDDFQPLKPALDPTLESLHDHVQVEKPQLDQFSSPGSFMPLKPSSNATLDSTHLSDFSSIRGSPVKGQRFQGLTSWGRGQGSNVMTSSPLKTVQTPGSLQSGVVSSQQLRDDVQAMRDRHRREREILLEGALSHLEREDFVPALPKEERGILEESDLTLVESTLIEGPIGDDKEDTLLEDEQKREDSGSSLVEGRITGDMDTLQEEIEHSDDQSPSLMSFEQHEWSVSLESSQNSGEQVKAKGPANTGPEKPDSTSEPVGTSQQKPGTTTDDTMDSLKRALSAWKDSRRF
ncbi:CEP295 [Branchiostoma lanceolatum]|uniref:CEP295 protein n=1 Tax=Branchiostoma lanceolatum TaxID=7740 RepID=A0A8K0EAW5_BRALA|nr:CEP295 [Branchiostoma lanceolatum]